jgi:Sulfotransferase domain
VDRDVPKVWDNMGAGDDLVGEQQFGLCDRAASEFERPVSVFGVSGSYKHQFQNTSTACIPFSRITGVLTNFPGDSIDRIEQLQRPRHIKSHLTKSLLPDQLWTVKPKIVYVARNPKDVVISFFHHYRNIVGYRGTKEDFIEAFLNDNIIYSPFFEHILDFWNVRHENNVLFLTYEDMKAVRLKIVSEIDVKNTIFGAGYNLCDQGNS